MNVTTQDDQLVAAGLRHHPVWTVADLAADLATARDRLVAMEAEDVSVAAAFDLSYQDLTAGQHACSVGSGYTPVPISMPALPRLWTIPACRPPGGAWVSCMTRT
jgi:hypothetical protein